MPLRCRRPIIVQVLILLMLALASAGCNKLLPQRERLVAMGPTLQVLAIIAGTLISEDLTCITVGTLIHHNEVHWYVGGVACFLGIYIGDLTFFFLGRFGGQRLLRMRFFSRSLGEQRLKQFGEWFDRKPWAAIMACRFLPGIRVPLYLSVGALTHRTKAFFWWTCFFACIWTPALILLVIYVGDAFTRPFEWITGGAGWISIVLGIVALYLVIRLVMLMSTAEGRRKLKGKFAWITGKEAQRTTSPDA